MWRMTLEGDDYFFEPRVRHEGILILPELPSNLETRFEPGDGSGRMAIELHLVPQTDSGVVILIGDKPSQVKTLWKEIMAGGGCEMPRLDDHTYGDAILKVFRTQGTSPPQWSPINGAPGEIVWPMRAPIRYRYDFSEDGVLTEARAWGPDVDLMIDVSAKDKYRCQYGEEISFVETLREYCEEFATTYTGLLLHCNQWSE
ncbi:MAG: hypothetical protein IFK94_12900 [Acidobacteria bacterium]|uniref:Uncharacterized protein n=1 Tax=Candidatus Polarisedimenticola svalbardensis TaxID=2886004 RepID=A0A8J6XWF0_9BACT|nr:hypothetical protein [Candidatus Polarisedimenticola svalbardensis]